MTTTAPLGPGMGLRRPLRGVLALLLGLVGLPFAVLATAGPADAAPVGTYRGYGFGTDSPEDIAPGPDGAVWFTNDGLYASIGRVTPAGDIENVTDPSIAHPTDLTLGPDGAVWFTDTSTDRIGRVGTDGTVTAFAGSHAGDVNDPVAITLGPDGNLWYLNDAPFGSVGRITPAGTTTRFAEGLLLEVFSEITSGPDGNLWFTVPGSDEVAHLAPDGTGLVRIVLPSAALPSDITAGPDDNLWFTDRTRDGIVKVTPSGVVSAPITHPSIDSPSGIVAGPDGRLWFANGPTATIDAVTTAGVVTSYAPPAAASPRRVVAGPDGRMWFTNVGSVGHIDTNGLNPVDVDATTDQGQPFNAIITAPDGNLWATDSQHIVRQAPDGTRTRFDAGLPACCAAYSIANAHDGTIWFANTQNQIGRMTTTGTLLPDLVGAKISNPRAIVAGPNGRMWLRTSAQFGGILEISTDGAYQEIHPTPGVDAQAITLGPDGNLWFTTGAPDKIGRMTPAGAVALYEDPAGLVQDPAGITAGPDGRLWFTNTGNHSISAITTSGTVTTYGVGQSVGIATPTSIVQGHDGALWFTNNGSTGLGRVTTSGSFTTFPRPGDGYGYEMGSGYTNLTPGPVGNGAMWYVGWRLGAIVRVSTTATTAPGAPTATSAVAGTGSATVSWSAPASPGTSPVTGYTVAASPGGRSCTWTSGPRTCTVTGLANGVPHTFTVTATNLTGPGPASSPSAPVTPTGPPGAPTGPAAVPGDASAAVSWAAPASTGGLPVTSYIVTASPGGHTCTWTSGPLTCAVTGLANDVAHTFTVVAANAKGPGPPSVATAAVTPSDDVRFHALPAPMRIVDSRPTGPSVGGYTTPWGAGATRDVAVAGVGGVPDGADAVVLNVTVTGTTAASHLSVWPRGAAEPTASSLNWPAGATIANAVTVKVGTSGMASVRNNSGSADVIVDVVGWYDRSAGGAGFTSVVPHRALDSRPGPGNAGGYATPWGAGTDRLVTVVGSGGVPVDASAVVLNVTVTGTTAPSHLTVYPAGATRPTASTLNWPAGTTIANAATTAVGTGGAVRIFNNAGSAHVIVDVVGWFRAGSGDGFHPVSPLRIQDSRPGVDNVGAYATPWAAATARTISVTTGAAVPPGAQAVLTNVTVTGTSAASHLTVWNTGVTQPTASSLNWGAGTTIAGAVTTKVGTGASISAFNNAGTVHVIADVAGWYG